MSKLSMQIFGYQQNSPCTICICIFKCYPYCHIVIIVMETILKCCIIKDDIMIVTFIELVTFAREVSNFWHQIYILTQFLIDIKYRSLFTRIS